MDIKTIKIVIAVMVLTVLTASCEKTPPVEPSHFDNVLLLYSAGFNNLSYDLNEDIRDMASGYLPSKNTGHAAVLVYSRKTKKGYAVPTESYLIRLYSGKKGKAVMDTVYSWPSDVIASSAETVHDVLSYVNEHYPADRYGMIFSSHASGWLPSGYYSKTKSIGADYTQDSSAYEMEIEDFASAIPMQLDYIIMDACLMGGVEVAYALKDKCRNLIFSQAEVLSDGLCNYVNVTERLLKGESPDLDSVCEDAYEYYTSDASSAHYLTISMIDCTKLNPLAEACRKLFSKYRNNIYIVTPSNIQRYWRFDKHWFYDMEDILVQSGIPDDELEEYREALSSCVLYNKATDWIFSIKVRTHCGLSMYLPAAGNSELDEFYKTLSWNKAVGLVN